MLEKNLMRFTFYMMFILFLSACANTSITESWNIKEGDTKRSFKSPMVLVISDSQQTRRIYEDRLIAGLKDEGISAVSSYSLIEGKQPINRELIDTVVDHFNQTAYNDRPIDSVLISYLAVEDKELTMQDSPLGDTYSGDAEDNMLSATLIVGRGRFNTDEVIPLKHDLYDVQKKSIVWSVQTETDDLTTIDALVLSVIERLVEELIDDEVFE